MYEIDLSSKKALVFGVSNERSIGWHVCEILHRAGASIAIAYQSERFKSRVEKLAKGMNNVMFVQCDVSFDDQIEQAFKAVGKEYGRLDYLVHSIAFAQREDLGDSVWNRTLEALERGAARSKAPTLCRFNHRVFILSCTDNSWWYDADL